MFNTILAIDSSFNFCSVALYKKKHIYSLSKKCEKKHTVKILPMIQKILLHTQTKFEELNYICFAKGPGNFTSIRIAGSIAQSFSISLKIPIIGISTLAIMAEKAWRKYKQKKVIVVINARRKEAYWAKYIRKKKSIWIGEHTESLLKTKLIKDKIDNLQSNWTIVGNGLQKIQSKSFLNQNITNIFYPNARDIIPFVLLKIKNKKLFFFDENNIHYLYNKF